MGIDKKKLAWFLYVNPYSFIGYVFVCGCIVNSLLFLVLPKFSTTLFLGSLGHLMGLCFVEVATRKKTKKQLIINSVVFCLFYVVTCNFIYDIFNRSLFSHLKQVINLVIMLMSGIVGLFWGLLFCRIRQKLEKLGLIAQL